MQVLARYAEALGMLPVTPAAAAPQEHAAVALGKPASSSFVAAATREVATAQADAARDLLLLLAYIGNVRSLGTYSFNSSEWQIVQSSIIPKVLTATFPRRPLSCICM